MKALNKFLSLILSCVMVMSLCIPAFASERMSSEELDTPFIMDIDNGKLFSAESDDKIVAILTNDDLHLIDISISYSPARDEVYHWAISDYPDDEFSYNDSFWTAIITYAENHLEDSNLVLFTTTVYDAPDSSIDMCASANRDLRDQLVNLLGTDIYPSKERHRESYQGVTFTVYEQLTFDIRSVQNVSWSTPITVASLIVGYLGKVVKEPLVVTICSVFGVVLDAASYLPAGKSLNRYRCAGLYSHYTQASGSSKVYNRTYRYVYYEGYEEVDGYLRAQIDSSSKTVEFDKGQSYYYDYPLQVQDAYQSYKIMG